MNDISHSLDSKLFMSTYEHFYEIVSFHIIHCWTKLAYQHIFSLSLIFLFLLLRSIAVTAIMIRFQFTTISSIRILYIYQYSYTLNSGKMLRKMNGYRYRHHLWLAVSTLCVCVRVCIYSIDHFLHSFLNGSRPDGSNKSEKTFIHSFGLQYIHKLFLLLYMYILPQKI